MGRPRKNFQNNLNSELNSDNNIADTSPTHISSLSNFENPNAQSSSRPQSAPMGAALNDLARSSLPKRIPIGKQKKLIAPQRPGFVRRFVNDVDNRIEQFKLAGYKPVEGNFSTSEQSKDVSIMGSQIRRHVGRGVYAVLMEIQEDWYQEDQKAKLKQNYENVTALTTPNPEKDQYGEVRTETRIR